MDKTLGSEMERIQREIDNLPWLYRLVLNRRLGMLRKTLEVRRNDVLRRHSLT